MKRISVKQIRKKMREREEAGDRCIVWSISTDMRDLVSAIRRDFEVEADVAHKLALKVVKDLLPKL